LGDYIIREEKNEKKKKRPGSCSHGRANLSVQEKRETKHSLIGGTGRTKRKENSSWAKEGKGFRGEPSDPSVSFTVREENSNKRQKFKGRGATGRWGETTQTPVGRGVLNMTIKEKKSRRNIHG